MTATVADFSSRALTKSIVLRRAKQAMQIVPLPSKASVRERLLAMLDDSPKWLFLRARAGFDKKETVQGWLRANPRRMTSSLWIEALPTEHHSVARLTELLDSTKRYRVIVLDATRAQFSLDVETLNILGVHAQQVVVIARSSLTLPDHLPALLSAPVIEAEALAFTAHEILDLIPDIDQERAQRIHELTSGWPALVRLVAPHQPHTSLALGRVATRFAEEKLSSFSARAKTVMLATSVVQEPTLGVTVELSELVEEDARAGWEEIVSEGFATVAYGKTDSSWRMIPLIRDAQHLLLRENNPTRALELDRRAARWFASHSQPVEAAHHAIMAKDWDTAIEVIEDAAYSLFATHPLEARDLLARIPAEAVDSRAIARVLSQMLSTSGHVEAGFAAARDAYVHVGRDTDTGDVHQILRQEDIDDGAIEVGLNEAIKRRHRGDFTGALEFHRSLHRGVEKRAGVLRSATRAYLPIIYLQRGISSMLAGNFVDAEREFIDATQDGRHGFAALAQRNGFADIALLAAVEGDIPRAQENLNRMRERPLVTGFWARVVQFGELVAEALVATELLELEVARAALDKASRSADRDELWAFYLLARARFAVADGSAGSALYELDSLRRTRNHLAGFGSAAAFLLPWAEAEMLMAAGQTSAAGAVLKKAPSHPLLSGIQALQRLQIGDPGEAIALAGSDLWSHEAGPSARALGFLARAAAELQLSMPADAATSFRFALKLIGQFKNRRLLGMLPHHVLTELGELVSLAVEIEGIPEMFPAPVSYVALTERERIVLSYLTTGANIRSISSTLFVTENTVRSQVRSIYRKLNVNSRDEAVAEAHKRGIIL